MSDDAEDVRALVNEGRGMMDYAEMQAALARMAAEKNELLLWKRWTTALDMVVMASKSMTLEDRQRATVWHFAMTRYGCSLRYARQEANLTMGDVQDKLGIQVTQLSGVERGREPPFDAATTRRLCALIGVDPEPLLREAEKAVRVMLELAGGVTK